MAKKRKTKRIKAKKTKVKKTKVKRTRTAKKNKPERQPNQDVGTPEHVPPTPTVLGPNSATDL